MVVDTALWTGAIIGAATAATAVTAEAEAEVSKPILPRPAATPLLQAALTIAQMGEEAAQIYAAISNKGMQWLLGPDHSAEAGGTGVARGTGITLVEHASASERIKFDHIASAETKATGAGVDIEAVIAGEAGVQVGAVHPLAEKTVPSLGAT